VAGRRPWGWHRLDPYWAEQIVAGAAIRPGELVVDLGAGTGALTVPLLEAGARVIAVSCTHECSLGLHPPGVPPVVANPPYASRAVLHLSPERRT
jgi:methylase of polypeptide subunit release factors